ncbi:hypothetical protein DKX38_017015 [Salix brachista]|uniref:Uncharacterized protein n=1 Tax=Salix brachista TaxID=2182728 RepID=A0A5N5KU35_9ROSI|nr:hypothetical protein DKX38_017015 [Salix brachista]
MEKLNEVVAASKESENTRSEKFVFTLSAEKKSFRAIHLGKDKKKWTSMALSMLAGGCLRCHWRKKPMHKAYWANERRGLAMTNAYGNHVQGGMQSFFAGLAASGALASSPRLITKAALDESEDGPRKGVSMSLFFKIYFTANSCIDQLELLFDTSVVLFLGISTFLEFLCALLCAYFFPKLPVFTELLPLKGSLRRIKDCFLAAVGILKPANQEVLRLSFYFPRQFWLGKSVLSPGSTLSDVQGNFEILNRCHFMLLLQAAEKLALDEFILCYAESIGRTTIMIAELAALQRGLELVLENGWSNVWL